MLICASAFILRLAIIYLGRHAALSGDGFAYSIQANFNARGEWFVNPLSAARPADALHPPAWTLLLTAWAWFGQHSWLSQGVLATAVGSLTVGAVGLAGRQVGGERVGLIAAGIAAIYPGFWVYERALLSETLLLLGIAIMILLAYRFWARPSAALAAILGIVCGLIALTRSEQIMVFVFVIAPLVLTLRRLSWRRRFGWLALSALCVVVVVTPWTIYNLSRFQRPVLLSNNFGSAVAQGNCPSTYYGQLTGTYSLYCLVTPLAVSHDQSVANSQLLHQGVTYMEHHLGRFPVVLFAREGRTFGFWDPFQQVHLDAEWEGATNSYNGISYVPTADWVNGLALVGFWLLIVPAVGGIVVLRRRRIPVYPMLGFFVIVILTVAATFGQPRYRAAIEVPLVLLAAVGISAALDYKRPVRSNNGGAVGQSHSSVALTGASRDPVALADGPQRLTDKVPIRALATCVLLASFVALGAMLTLPDAAPEIRNVMVAPANGATVQGNVLLVATPASGAIRVQFRVTGGQLRDAVVVNGRKEGSGWIAHWNATSATPGTYAIWSVAYNGGSEVASPPVKVTVTSGAR